jgi:MFS family permease
MYQVEASSALRMLRLEPLRLARFRAGRNILALGFTSLLTDVSSEMVTTVLPMYLVLYVGLTPMQFGIVDGLHNGITAFVRLLGGLLADRRSRYKEIAAVGYALSALCKPVLALTGGAVPLIAATIAVDRLGKGIRTAPRDALISLSATPANLASAFGVHRALDGAGAMLGPFAAMSLLFLLPDRFDVVFVASFSIAIVGLGVLLLFVNNVRRLKDSPALSAAGDGIAAVALPATRGLTALTVAATILSVTTISDSFVYLLLQRRAGFNSHLFPLMYIGTAVSYLILAIPAGRLADLIGRRAMFLGGHVLLIALYFTILRTDLSGRAVVGSLVLLGAYYAATDGVLMALAAGVCEPERRATGLAVISTCTSSARLIAPIVFGTLWTRYSATTAATAFIGALMVSVVMAGGILATWCRACEPDVNRTE